MRTRNLTLAILFGLGITNAPLLISTAQAEQVQADIEQVQSRIGKINETMTRATNRFLGSAPSIDKISISTSDYQTKANGATAKTSLNIDFAPQYLAEGEPQHFTLNFADTIDTDADLQSKGIIAHIEREIVIDDNLKKLLDMDDQDIKKFSHAMQHLQISMDLLPEGKIKQTVKITPFEFNEDGTTVKFDGLTINTDEDEATMIDGVGKMHLEAGQLSANSEGKTLTTEPFTLDYALNDSGDLKLDSSPLKLTTKDGESNGAFTIERITGKGSNIHFDDAIGSYIGTEEYLFDNIQFTSDKMPAPIVIDNARVNAKIDKSSDLYNYDGGFVIDFDGESISKVTGMTGLELEDSKINFRAKNISAHTMQTLNKIYASVGALQPDEKNSSKITDEISAQGQALLNDLAQNQSSFDFDFAIDTDQGDATFVTNIKVKKDAVTDLNAWQQAAEAQQPNQMLSLMQRSLDFNIKLNIPESLLNATGMTPMMAMGAGFIIKDGSNYTMHIENTSKGIELNGNLLPMPGAE